MMDQNFEIRIVIFEIFFEIFKKASRGPSAADVDHYAAAKLDHSRVLVTKFHQNRSTLKGRSAGQRQTDRQTRLKIMALQVCNRANRTTVRYSIGRTVFVLQTVTQKLESVSPSCKLVESTALNQQISNMRHKAW